MKPGLNLGIHEAMLPIYYLNISHFITFQVFLQTLKNCYNDG